MNDRFAKDSSFLDVVFSWSYEDIINENLYKDKVKKIPESFEIVPDYFSSFLYPLLEETRADLCSNVESISKAPFAEVVSYAKVKADPSKTQSQLYDVRVDNWRNRFNDRGQEPYKTLPGDVFAIVNSQPETFHKANIWVLAAVTKVSQGMTEDQLDYGTSSTSFRVKASKDIGLMDDNYSSLFVIFLRNVTTNKRIWNGLHMYGNLKIIRGVLQKDIVVEESHSPSFSMNTDGLNGVLGMEISSILNPSQSEAVLASLQAMQCTHKSQVNLVWGPPGTGKTKTLATLLYFLLKMNFRTLTCAPTNIAITEVAGRVLELMKNSSLKDSEGYLGNILLFGNNQQLRVSSHLEDIYLDYRVERLAECFAPLTGWRSCLPALSNLLENCVSQYNIFVENELMKVRDQINDGVDTMGEIKSFLVYLRDLFKATARPVRRCITIFCTHVSRSYVGQHNVDNMKSLRGLLDAFEEMLFEDDLDSAGLLKLFSSGEVRDLADGLWPLDKLRRNCISILRSLHRSLCKLNIPNSMSKQSLIELCFKMASLVFCTVSGSYKLYSLPMEPLSLLVIDEAAQLKECESAIPLQLPGLRHAILFGDECQLPAVLNSKICRDAGFGRSLFQRLSLLGWPKHLLDVQYRMHPSISAFPNAKFYSNQILDAPSVKSKSYERHYLEGPMYGPYSFINISDGREERDDDCRSRRNMVEAAVVVKIVQNLYKTWRGSEQTLGIGIISPYAAQVVTIEQMLGRRYENLENFGVKVKSVDGFQGGEEDIIIISTVRSNDDGSIGFISNYERTNVALTRGRYCLWVLGHEETLTRSDSIWNSLVCNASRRHCFFNAEEDKSLAQVIFDAKKELDQLDDLLNKDSILFKNARWKVLFSNNFVQTFSKLPSLRTKKSVMNLLVRLSNGWRPKKIKVEPVCDSSVHIVKQYKVEGLYVICTKDIVKDARYMQVLKIWDVVPLEDVAKLVKRLDNVYGTFTDCYLSRCKETCVEGDLEVPKTWSTSLDIIRYKSYNSDESESASAGDLSGIHYAENAKVSESLLLMKFYSLSAGIVGHLLSDADGRALLDLPFEVTDEEMQIILYHKSSFILGRSGTGKTTVLTMKLFQKEQLHHMALEGLGEACREASTNTICSDESEESGSVLRQLFVTVSPKLCYAIKQHVSHFKIFARNQGSSVASVSVDVDDIDDNDQFRGIPDSFVGIPSKSYPLVITFNKFLLMLDGTLGTSFFDRFHGEMKFFDEGNISQRPAALLMKVKEVNYEKFSMCYWPHFNSQLTKKLDASRVFIEIISSIKGGLQVGDADNGRLNLEDYLQLSEGRTSTLNQKEREYIYEIFLNYEKLKVERGEFDLADIVNDLHWRLMHERYGGDSIDFIYIDEVQDLTMRQIALFKYISSNVDEGFVLSGDTAQTIARGVDFRFEDVRCLFFKEFLKLKSNDGSKGSQEKGQISPIFHLSQNFRTHAGILNLGQSVIELLYHFFPQSIDNLPPETSLIFGEAPILLESGTDENAIVTIFGNTGNVGGNLVGFGAEQVILVRDDCVRKEISSFVGKNALVLTIVECKGLEFQDVLLYNFFGSSQLRNKWRVVYEFMKKQNMLDSTFPQSFPYFDPGKHNVLCSELKQLYVAITRTKQRLWICENKQDLSKPMFDYWKKKCVVQVRQLDDSLAQAMQVASSPEEWKARGKKLLAVSNYEVATMCFERAGDRHWECYARAAGLRASAGRIRHLNAEEASRILRQAAELFENIKEYRKAADCFYELKEYDRAGEIYLQHCGELELERAGDCFTLAGKQEQAAEVYAKGNLFSKCMLSCTKGKLFDMGLQYILYWKQKSTLSSAEMGREIDKVEQSFLETCAQSHFEKDDKRAMMKYVKAFSSEDSMRSFLRSLECLDELLILEEELGNFSKAADIAREMGDFMREADLLEKGGLCKEACALFLWYAFASCLWAGGANGWPLKHFPQNEELLLKAKAAASNIEPHLLYKTVCIDVLILLNRKYLLSELRELLIMSKCLKNLRGQILCTRRILDLMLQYDVLKYEQDSDFIEDLAAYSLQRISASRMSIEVLMYFWSSWKEIILAILKYLEAVERNETSEFAAYGEFCLNYLGVRKQSLETGAVYVCLYPDAEWMREVEKRSLQALGKLVSIDAHYLVAAAHNHWCAELLSTGMKVLHVLGLLQKNGTQSSSSALSKTRIVIHVYEISKFLYSSKFLKQRHKDSMSLQRFIDLSVEEYFDSVFPIDWRNSVNKNMTLLRETEISRKILEEVIVKNVPMRGKPTYGQLGRVAMVLLGSSKCKTKLYDIVVGRLDTDSRWKPFLEVLSGYRGSETSNRTMDFHCTDAQVQVESSLACKLRDALCDVYDVNWRTRDHISPSCFLYLVDRLLISLLEFQGLLMITRSSLVEWLLHHKWKTSPCTNSETGGDRSVFVGETYRILARIVHQLLVNTNETVQWVKNVGIVAKGNFPVLLLRLVVLMCLLHLNSGMYLDVLRDVLHRRDIMGQLPLGFQVALRRREKGGFIKAFAEALKEIEDPLVIVRTGSVHPKFSCRNAIFVHMVNKNKEDLLKILFPGEVKALSNGDHGPLPQDRNERCAEFTDGSVLDFYNALKLIENDSSRQNLISNSTKIKVQVGKIHELLTLAMTSENNNCDDVHINYVNEAECLLLELRLLSAALHASGQLLTDSILLIKDSSRRLLSRKAVFEYFLGPLIPNSEVTNVTGEGDEDETMSPLVKSEEGDVAEEDDDHDAKAGEDNNEEEGQKDDSSATAPGNQNGSQGSENNKGKGKKKPKRSKNKKKRKN